MDDDSPSKRARECTDKQEDECSTTKRFLLNGGIIPDCQSGLEEATTSAAMNPYDTTAFQPINFLDPRAQISTESRSDHWFRCHAVVDGKDCQKILFDYEIMTHTFTHMVTPAYPCPVKQCDFTAQTAEAMKLHATEKHDMDLPTIEINHDLAFIIAAKAKAHKAFPDAERVINTWVANCFEFDEARIRAEIQQCTEDQRKYSNEVFWGGVPSVAVHENLLPASVENEEPPEDIDDGNQPSTSREPDNLYVYNPQDIPLPPTPADTTSVSSDRSLQCSICGKPISEKLAKCISHAKTHVDEKQYQCPQCAFEENSYRQVEAHHRAQHGGEMEEIVEKKSSFLYEKIAETTRLCFPTFPQELIDEWSANKIKKLDTSQESGINEVRGEASEISQSSEKPVERKPSREDLDRLNQPSNYRLQCQLCINEISLGDESEVAKAAFAHASNHADIKPFGCSICDFVARRPAHVIKHFASTHSGLHLEILDKMDKSALFRQCSTAVRCFPGLVQKLVEYGQETASMMAEIASTSDAKLIIDSEKDSLLEGLKSCSAVAEEEIEKFDKATETIEEEPTPNNDELVASLRMEIERLVDESEKKTREREDSNSTIRERDERLAEALTDLLKKEELLREKEKKLAAEKKARQQLEATLSKNKGRDERLAKIQADLLEKEKILKEKEIELAAEKETRVQLEATLSSVKERDKRLAKLQADLLTKEKLLREKETELAAEKEVRVRLEATMSSTAQTVQENEILKNEQIRKSAEELAELRAKNEETEKAFLELKRKLKDSSKKIQMAHECLGNMTLAYEKLKKENKDLQQENATLRAAANRREDEDIVCLN